MKAEIEKLFNQFLNDVNSPFIKVEFTDDKKKYRKKKLNKATVMRGNIKFLEQEVLKIINNKTRVCSVCKCKKIILGDKEIKGD